MTSMELITLARGSREDAPFLAYDHMGNKAALSKLYQAMMYCLFAQLDMGDLKNMTHAGVIKRFEQEYVKKGKADASILAVLNRAYELTHNCSCDHMPVPTNKEMELAMKVSEELISLTEGLLRTEVRA